MDTNQPHMYPVKRYAAFAWSDYYPAAGFGDYIGSCDTLEDAMLLLKARHKSMYSGECIVDMHIGEEH